MFGFGGGSEIEMRIVWSQALTELEKKVPKAAEVLTDMERLADEVLFPFMRSHVEEVYQTQGRPPGTVWADYSDEPQYRMFKAGVLGYETSDGEADPSQLPIGQNAPGGLMRWEGQERLQPSLTQRQHPEHIEDTFELKAWFGTSVPYAKRLAQTGGTNLFGEPYDARPVLAMRSRRKQTLLEAAGGWFRAQLHEVGIL